MKNFHKKHKANVYKRIMYSTPVIILLIILTIMMAKQTWNMYAKASLTEKNQQEAEAVYENEKTRENELTAKINRLQTESGIEEEIRNTYGYIREGEEMVMVVDGETPVNKEKETEERSLWTRIKDWF